MTKQILMVALTALALPAFSQTNAFTHQNGGKQHGERKRGENSERGRSMERYRDLSPEEKAERQERRLQLMEKTLEEIGVTEEQRAQISSLQKKLRMEMEQTSKKAGEARRKLSELEKTNAPEEEIFAAIDAVSDAQAEQMKVLARNKIAMERILGKEKYRQFMDAARSSYRKHGGRHGGSGFPPRPPDIMPPTPDGKNHRKTPPLPDSSSSISKPPTPPA